MEKILRKLIEYGLRGVDTYTHNGSTWLIFTDNKQWVIELTDNKTLWYNYNFFKQLFCVATDDVIKNQKHITKWVENNLINKKPTCVTHFRDARDRKQQFEDTLENGVKYTKMAHMKTDWSVEDTIENGVKETRFTFNITEGEVDDIVQDGVKHTARNNACADWEIEDTIQNGVRDTHYSGFENQKWVDGVIKGGVKETNPVDVMKFFDNKMEDTLQNGVKETIECDWADPNQINEVIREGVKETYEDVYHHKGRIDGVIKNGVKKTKVSDYNIPGEEFYITDQHLVDEVLENGVKETKEMLNWVCTDRMLSNILENGIKETKTPGWDGDIISTVEWLNENNSTSYPKMINDVIENGVKETVAAGYTDPKTNILHIKWGDQIDDVIDNGVKETNVGKRDWTITTNDVIQEGVKETKSIGKESPNYPRPVINHIIKNGEKINGTYAGGQRQSEKCKSVVEYGTKNPTD